MTSQPTPSQPAPTQSASTQPTPWLLTPQRRPEAAAQLFCLPAAGGGASSYRRWPRALGSQVEVHAVQLPGREHRLDEPPALDLAALTAAIEGAADRPYALFGHSMGGRLAFDVVRRLRADGAPLPRVLFVAACRAPDVQARGPLDGLSELPDDELMARVARNGSLPPEIAAEEQLRELFLPALRADFEWVDGYRYTEQPPLPVPIVAFAGSHDEAVPADQIAGWERQTSAGFTLHTIDGDHFFPQQRCEEVAGLVRERLPGHLLAAGGRRVALGGWSVWRDALLRTTGFPADGLDRLVAPECAEAADAYLEAGAAGDPTEREQLEQLARQFDKQLGAAVAESSAQVRAIAAEPKFREAVTWQTPSILSTLDGLISGKFRPSVARHRELAVVRYWQRYCAKNETIGFFGPVCWARLDGGAAEAVRAQPGPGLLRQRRVSFETWALAAYGDVLAADPQLRGWLRPVRQPHLHIEDGAVRRPPRPPERLSKPELAALAACDGSRTATEVVRGLGLPKQADGVLLLERLVARGLLRWDADLPFGPEAESVLARRIAEIGEAPARQRAQAGLDRLRAARDEVTAAAGDPAALAGALAGLDAEFTDLTGLAPQRRPGQSYAGRRLCFEDAERDLSVQFGQPLLAELAAPLGLLLRAARWLCGELAQAYGSALRELYEELADGAPGGVDGAPGAAGTAGAAGAPGGAAGGPEMTDSAGAGVNLAELWFLAQGMLFGAAERPVDGVVAEFQRRWAELLGLGNLSADTRTLRLRATDLAEPVARVFPDRGSGWSAGRLHSPDLQICAPSVAAVNRGDFTVVLGELHVGWPVFDNALFTGMHPHPEELVEELARDLGPHRVRLLYPPDWPRAGGRLAATLAGPTDVQLGFAPAPGADRQRLVPAAALRVRPAPDTGELRAYAPDGHSFPLLEVFSSLLALHTVDSFKLLDLRVHTPRISVDRLVVSRETWRTTVAETGLAEATGDRERFLAARRWRRRLGLPERVFVRLGTETKPIYVDFRSLLYVRSLCTFARAAAGEGGGAVSVVVTEMLPTPEQAWVSDAAGDRYFSELRLQVGEADG